MYECQEGKKRYESISLIFVFTTFVSGSVTSLITQTWIRGSQCEEERVGRVQCKLLPVRVGRPAPHEAARQHAVIQARTHGLQRLHEKTLISHNDLIKHSI